MNVSILRTIVSKNSNMQQYEAINILSSVLLHLRHIFVCIYLIKNTVKSIILQNITKLQNSEILLKFKIKVFYVNI